MSTDAPQARRVIGHARRTGIPVVVPPPLRRAEGDAGSAATLPAASPPPLLARPSPRLGRWDGADADAADAAADGGADADELAAVAARLDALQARMESHELIFQQIVAQTVMINDTVGALGRKLSELHDLPGLAQRLSPPLQPAFELQPASPPLSDPPTRPMTEYEKRWLTKWMRIGHYSRARYGGMIAIADPKVAASKLADPAKYVRELKIFKYNDYTLWKLWHYVRDGAPLEAVLTPEECGNVERITLTRSAAAAAARPTEHPLLAGARNFERNAIAAPAAAPAPARSVPARKRQRRPTATN